MCGEKTEVGLWAGIKGCGGWGFWVFVIGGRGLEMGGLKFEVEGCSPWRIGGLKLEVADWW